MNVFHDYFTARSNVINNIDDAVVVVPYILSMPLLLTAATPTIYRIIFVTAAAKNNGSNRNKTTKWNNEHDDKYYTTGNKRIQQVVVLFVTYAIPCLILYNSNRIDAIYTAVLWYPLTNLLSNWPRAIIQQPFNNNKLRTKQPSKNSVPQQLQSLILNGGPFGYGCSKVIQVIVACLLWKFVRGTLPPTIISTLTVGRNVIRSMQGSNWIHVVVGVVILTGVSWIVTVVLSLWLQYTQSKGG